MTTLEMRNCLLWIPLKCHLMIRLLPQLTPNFKSKILFSPRHSIQSMTITIILMVLVPSIQMEDTSGPNFISTRSGISFDMELSILTRMFLCLILIILSLRQSIRRLNSFNVIISLFIFPSEKSRIWKALERSHVISRTSRLLPVQGVFLVQ